MVTSVAKKKIDAQVCACQECGLLFILMPGLRVGPVKDGRVL